MIPFASDAFASDGRVLFAAPRSRMIECWAISACLLDGVHVLHVLHVCFICRPRSRCCFAVLWPWRGHPTVVACAARQYACAVDVWSIGCIFAEMVTR